MKILLCDDHALLLDALAAALAAAGHQVAATSTLEEGITKAADMQPDVCLLDVSFPAGNGLDAARTIIAEGSCSKIVMLSANVDAETLASAALSGAVGFVAKTQGIAEIRDALTRVCSGETVVSVPEGRLRVQRHHGGKQEQRLLSFLTEREKHVLRDLVDGHSTTVIAERLGITVNTARTHVQNALVKLGVHTRLQAAAVVASAGGTEALGVVPESTAN